MMLRLKTVIEFDGVLAPEQVGRAMEFARQLDLGRGENPAELSRKLCEAIERSRSHDEIVHVEVDDLDQAREMLLSMSDDDADTDWDEVNDGVVEVWCAADDAPAGEMLWRVHLESAE